MENGMIDAYLKIEGINGESEDDRHKNWIEVSNVLYAIHQPRAETVSTAGGLTSGRAELHPITFQKLPTSPRLSCCKPVRRGKRLQRPPLNS